MRYFFLWCYDFTLNFTYNVTFGENLIGWREREMTLFPQHKVNKRKSELPAVVLPNSCNKTQNGRFTKQLTFHIQKPHQFYDQTSLIVPLLSDGFTIWVQFIYSCKVVSTRKKKRQHKRQLGQLNEILNDFIIENSANADATGNQGIQRTLRSCRLLAE